MLTAQLANATNTKANTLSFAKSFARHASMHRDGDDMSPMTSELRSIDKVSNVTCSVC